MLSSQFLFLPSEMLEVKWLGHTSFPAVVGLFPSSDVTFIHWILAALLEPSASLYKSQLEGSTVVAYGPLPGGVAVLQELMARRTGQTQLFEQFRNLSFGKNNSLWVGFGVLTLKMFYLDRKAI